MGLFEAVGQAAPEVRMISTGLIDPNPAQPRRRFDEQGIVRLAQSIKENGLLSPVSVRRCGKRYQLIAGERRLMAFRLLGRERIPAVIEKADGDKSAVLALVENLQRSDLDFLEEAAAIASLISCCELTQQEAAVRLGLSQSAVANKLRILRLPHQAALRLAEEGFGERHARALLPLAGDERLFAAVEKVIAEKMSAAQAEALAARLTAAPKPEKKGKRVLVVKDIRIFNAAIDRAVDVMKQAGIDAVAQKTENEESIVYTVVIPKPRGQAAKGRGHASSKEAF